GVLAGKSIAGWVKNRHLRAALDRAKELATEFRAQFLQCYANVVAAADSFFNVRSAASEEGMKQEGLLKRMLFPSVMTLFYVEALRRLAEDREACRKYYEDLKAEV